MTSGLRLRTALLLLSITLLLAGIASQIGKQSLDTLRHDLGSALVRDHARVVQQRIQSRIGLELALAQRLAASSTLRAWLQDEDDRQRRASFTAEAEGFRQAFTSRSYFVASERRRDFHYADEKTAGRLVHGYRLQEDKPDNAWYFTTVRQPHGYWINVDFDQALKVTNVWINAVARTGDGRVLGVAGTGIDLATFLKEMLSSQEAGITTMIVDREGNIVAHPDTSRMQFDLASAKDSEKNIHALLDASGSALLRDLFSRGEPQETASTFALNFEGETRLLAHAGIPGLGWNVITVLDTEHSSLLAPERISEILLAAGLLLAVLLIASTLGVDSLIIRPLLHLTESARSIAAGSYDIRLESQRSDELGELTRAFDHMAAQVRAHALRLEQQVAERTAALSAAHGKLTDSVRYASLIQSAILPDASLNERFPERHFVLWQPRDMVGGDLYFHRSGAQGELLGVIDCAGHGVPGACMTMIAHAALETALADTPWEAPEKILQRMDAIVRRVLPQEATRQQLATSIEIGLCHLAPGSDCLSFSGARIPLLWRDSEGIHRVRGDRRALNDRKPGNFSRQQLPLRPGQTFYLSTDGLLDQTGGEKRYAFGQSRLEAWIVEQGERELAEQRQSLLDTLETYRAGQVQRDDIVVLAFRPTRPAWHSSSEVNVPHPSPALLEPDLDQLRTSLSRQNILLCFNGPITAPLIEEIGTALRKHMESIDESPSAVSDVFSVYIEMAQNIRRYAQVRGYENEAATMLISRNSEGRYVICAANIVDDGDGKALVKRIDALGELDKVALKAAFKAQLRMPRESLNASAGLGLIDMARKAGEALQCSLLPQPCGRFLFSLRVVL